MALALFSGCCSAVSRSPSRRRGFLGVSALGVSLFLFACSSNPSPEAPQARPGEAKEVPSSPAQGALSPTEAPQAPAEEVAKSEGFGAGGPPAHLAGDKKRGRVRIGTPTVTGSYSEGVASRILRQNHGRYRLCFEATGGLAGSVPLSFSINEKGEATKVNAGASGGTPELLACVKKATSELAFPPPESGVATFSLELTFVPFEPEAPLPAPSATVPTLRFSEGLPSPGGVVYDSARDRYLVSNGSANEGHGFILVLDPEGKKPPVRLVTGGEKSRKGELIEFGEPRGMVLRKNLLFVGDEGMLRAFDVVTGEPKGAWSLGEEGAFAQKLIALGDGSILVTTATGRLSGGPAEESIFRLDALGKVGRFAHGVYGGLSGGVFVAKKPWFVNGSGNLFTLDPNGTPIWRLDPEFGGLYAVVGLSGDRILLGSYEHSVLASGPLGGPYVRVVEGVACANDLAWDSKRNRVLVVPCEGPGLDVYDLSRPVHATP